MSFVEITGQSCSGKTKFIEDELILNTKFHAYPKNFITKIFNFFVGIRYLGLERTKVLFLWSLNESASLFFRINIFRNAVLKFGNFKDLRTSIQDDRQTYILDEGVSHLPFLFLNTDTLKVVDFVSNELSRINVEFLKSPGHDIIKERLTLRGHKRLNFLSISFFTNRNQDIEGVLLREYPNLCKDLRIIKNVGDIQ